MSEKPTPGPWFVGAQNDCLFVTNRQPPRGDYNRGLKVICKVGPDRTDEANAWLIAAAPDLLEACRGLLTCSLPVDVSGQRFVEAARVAIAKAMAEGTDR